MFWKGRSRKIWHKVYYFNSKEFLSLSRCAAFLGYKRFSQQSKVAFLRILRTLSEAFLQPPLCRATTLQPYYHTQELVCKTILIRVFIFDQLLHPHYKWLHHKRLAPKSPYSFTIVRNHQSKSNQPTSTILNRTTRRDCLQSALLLTIIDDILIATYLQGTRIFQAIGHLVLPLCSRHLLSKTEVDWRE